MARKYRMRHSAAQSETVILEDDVQTQHEPVKTSGANASMKSGIFYSLLSNLVAPIAGLAIAPILSNALGDEGRGALGGITSLLLVVTAVGAIGLPETLTYFAARYVARTRSVVKLVSLLLALTGLICAVALYFAAPFLADGNGDGYALLVVLTAAALIPNMLVLVPRALAAASQMWTYQALEQGVFSILRLLAILVLLWTGNLTVLTAVIVTLLTPIMGALVYIPVLKKISVDQLYAANEKQPVGESLAYGGKVWLGSLSGVVLSRIDQALMIKLTTLSEQGLYAVAVTIGEVPSVISNAVRNVVFSMDSSEAGDAENKERVDARLATTARLTTFITLLVSLPVALTLPFWIGPVFGRDFENAVQMTWVLLAAAVVGSAGSVAGGGLSGRGNPGLRSLGMAIAAVLNLTVLLVLTPIIGAMGAALSTLVGSAVAGNLNILFLHIKHKIPLLLFYGLRKSDLKILSAAGKKLLQRLRIVR